MREKKIAHVIKARIINSEQADRLRERLKDVLFSNDLQSATDSVVATERMTERVLYRSGLGGRGVMVLEVMPFDPSLN